MKFKIGEDDSGDRFGDISKNLPMENIKEEGEDYDEQVRHMNNSASVTSMSLDSSNGTVSLNIKLKHSPSRKGKSSKNTTGSKRKETKSDTKKRKIEFDNQAIIMNEYTLES